MSTKNSRSLEEASLIAARKRSGVCWYLVARGSAELCDRSFKGRPDPFREPSALANQLAVLACVGEKSLSACLVEARRFLTGRRVMNFMARDQENQWQRFIVAAVNRA